MTKFQALVRTASPISPEYPREKLTLLLYFVYFCIYTSNGDCFSLKEVASFTTHRLYSFAQNARSPKLITERNVDCTQGNHRESQPHEIL